jgi:hypothetical protein
MLCPVELQVWVVDRMLNFEIADDPHYEGLELQVYDDPSHGRGMVVLLRRRGDGRLDIYRQPGLRVDPSIAAVGGELGEWREAVIDPARLEIGPFGVDVAVAMVDVDGRVIKVRIDDRDGRRRRPGTLLAPVGAVVEQPASLSLFLMGGCDLVRRGGRAFDVRIGGRRVATGRLPGGWLHRRRLVKYTADPTVVVCNPAADGPVAVVDPAAPGRVELGPAGTGIAALRAAGGWPPTHTARLGFDPALPDVARLVPGETAAGSWRLGVDHDPAVVAGTWTAGRRRDRVELRLEVTRGWRPRGLPLLMAAVTRVAPVFRSWPTTYRWSATVDLGGVGGQPRVRSGWERSGGDHGQSYRRLTAPSRGG